MAIYCRSHLNARVATHLCSSSADLEMVFIKIEIGKQEYLIGSIYRPPLPSITMFLEEFEHVLTAIECNYKDHTVVLMGDMNINVLKENCRRVEMYLDVTFCHGYMPQILRPTRVTATTKTVTATMFLSEKIPA